MRKILSIVATCLLCFATLTACKSDGRSGGETVVEHSYSSISDEGICDHCGKTLFKGKMKFFLSESKKYYTAEGSGLEGEVIVPEKYKGTGDTEYLPVLGLGKLTGDEMTSVQIPAAIEKISENPFVSLYKGNTAPKLKQISINGIGVKYCVKDNVLYDKNFETLIAYPMAKQDATYTLPDTVKTIESRAVFGNTSLTSITGDLVTEVKSAAFSNCTKLKTVSFEKSIEFGSRAFSGCKELTDITILTGSTLGEWLFDGCTALKKFTVPENVTLKDDVFANSNIQELTFNGALTVGASLLRDTVFHTITFKGNTTIKGNAFQRYNYLKKLSFNGGVIEKYAFYNCASLEEVSLDGITSIGDAAFFMGSGFDGEPIAKKLRVFIPSTVQTIGESAFYRAEAINVQATSRPTGWDPFWAGSDTEVHWGATGLPQQ